MTNSKIFLFFCLSFILGISFSSYFSSLSFLAPAFLILGLIFLSVFWNKKIFAVLGICLVIFSAGAFRQWLYKKNISENKIKEIASRKENVSISGKIVQEPQETEKTEKFIVKIDEFNTKIIVYARKGSDFKYGDRVSVEGTLALPGSSFDNSDTGFSVSNYQNYLEKDGILAEIFWPDIKLIKNGNKSILGYFYSAIFGLKERARQSIRQNFSYSYSIVAEGMILGDKTMPDDMKEMLNSSGLSHAIVVSGSHIVIISSILMSLLLLLGFWRGQAFYLSSFLIFVFVAMVGFQPSSVRAGVTGFIFLLAQKVGRKYAGFRALAFACAIMLLQNPLLLSRDIGFQLSFASAAGLFFFYAFFKNKLSFKFLSASWHSPFLEKIIGFFLEAGCATLSAYVFSLPILAINFGRFPMLSVFANIFALPVVYWIMIFGFLTAILGAVYIPLGYIFSLPCSILIGYFLKIASIFSGDKFSAKTGVLSWIFISILYFFFFLAYQLEKERERILFFKK
jgi:competence protein ComEC